jgi:AAA ATPase domain
MDPAENPFVPGAGTRPAKLAGRDELLNRTEVTLRRVKNGRFAKSFIVVGLRGVGKTVILTEVYDRSKSLMYHSVQIEAREDKSLPAIIIPKIRTLLLDLDRDKVTEYAKRGLRVLSGFINACKLKYQDVEFSLSVAPEAGSADSGDLESDLSDLFEAVGNAAKDRNTSIALVIDELQYVSEQEMSALIMAMHRIAQRNLPLVLVGGGLPQLVALAGRSKSYAERLFDYPRVGPLSEKDAYAAIREPIEAEGAQIEERALAAIFEKTQGYPYFIQTWGHFAWNAAATNLVTEEDIESATASAIENLDESFFRVRLDRLTKSEKSYLFAMSEIGPGPHRSGDIAGRLSRKVESVAPTRSALIKKGMVYSPSHGDTAFTVPMFDEYLKRLRKTVPDMSSKSKKTTF